MQKMKKISIFLNPVKDPSLQRCRKVILALSDFEGEFLLDEKFSREKNLTDLKNIVFVKEEALFSKGDMLLALGGDGTILSIASRAAETGIPIFGINFGNVGFMTSLEEKEVKKISALVRGEYTVSSRMLLSCRVGEGEEFLALNEFVIAPEKGFHMVELSLYTGRKKLCDFRADGLIFNTPTGSTGYAFSAGGAVIDDSFDTIGVKAVSSYLLINGHHMIFSPETVFTVKGARCYGETVTVCADGREKRVVLPDEKVKICRAKKRVNLIFLKERSNLEVFFRKF